MDPDKVDPEKVRTPKLTELDQMVKNCFTPEEFAKLTFQEKLRFRVRCSLYMTSRRGAGSCTLKEYLLAKPQELQKLIPNIVDSPKKPTEPYDDYVWSTISDTSSGNASPDTDTPKKPTLEELWDASDEEHAEERAEQRAMEAYLDKMKRQQSRKKRAPKKRGRKRKKKSKPAPKKTTARKPRAKRTNPFANIPRVIPMTRSWAAELNSDLKRIKSACEGGENVNKLPGTSGSTAEQNQGLSKKKKVITYPDESVDKPSTTTSIKKKESKDETKTSNNEEAKEEKNNTQICDPKTITEDKSTQSSSTGNNDETSKFQDRTETSQRSNENIVSSRKGVSSSSLEEPGSMKTDPPPKKNPPRRRFVPPPPPRCFYTRPQFTPRHSTATDVRPRYTSACSHPPVVPRFPSTILKAPPGPSRITPGIVDLTTPSMSTVGVRRRFEPPANRVFPQPKPLFSRHPPPLAPLSNRSVAPQTTAYSGITTTSVRKEVDILPAPTRTHIPEPRFVQSSASNTSTVYYVAPSKDATSSEQLVSPGFYVPKNSIDGSTSRSTTTVPTTAVGFYVPRTRTDQNSTKGTSENSKVMNVQEFQTKFRDKAPRSTITRPAKHFMQAVSTSSTTTVTTVQSSKSSQSCTSTKISSHSISSLPQKPKSEDNRKPLVVENTAQSIRPTSSSTTKLPEKEKRIQPKRNPAWPKFIVAPKPQTIVISRKETETSQSQPLQDITKSVDNSQNIRDSKTLNEEESVKNDQSTEISKSCNQYSAETIINVVVKTPATKENMDKSQLKVPPHVRPCPTHCLKTGNQKKIAAPIARKQPSSVVRKKPMPDSNIQFVSLNQDQVLTFQKAQADALSSLTRPLALGVPGPVAVHATFVQKNIRTYKGPGNKNQKSTKSSTTSIIAETKVNTIQAPVIETPFLQTNETPVVQELVIQQPLTPQAQSTPKKSEKQQSGGLQLTLANVDERMANNSVTVHNSQVSFSAGDHGKLSETKVGSGKSEGNVSAKVAIVTPSQKIIETIIIKDDTESTDISPEPSHEKNEAETSHIKSMSVVSDSGSSSNMNQIEDLTNSESGKDSPPAKKKLLSIEIQPKRAQTATNVGTNQTQGNTSKIKIGSHLGGPTKIIKSFPLEIGKPTEIIKQITGPGSTQVKKIRLIRKEASGNIIQNPSSQVPIKVTQIKKVPGNSAGTSQSNVRYFIKTGPETNAAQLAKITTIQSSVPAKKTTSSTSEQPSRSSELSQPSNLGLIHPGTYQFLETTPSNISKPRIYTADEMLVAEVLSQDLAKNLISNQGKSSAREITATTSSSITSQKTTEAKAEPAPLPEGATPEVEETPKTSDDKMGN